MGDVRRKTRLWTKEDVDFLRRNRGTMTAKEIAAKLGRRTGQVHSKITHLRKLGLLAVDSPFPPTIAHAWTKRELALLSADMQPRDFKCVAERTGRTVKAVRTKWRSEFGNSKKAPITSHGKKRLRKLEKTIKTYRRLKESLAVGDTVYVDKGTQGPGGESIIGLPKYQGKVVHLHDKHVTIQAPHYTEGFLFSAILAGDVKIERVM